MLWITNLAPRQVFAFSRNATTGADLYDVVSCRFQNGATGMLGGAATMPLDAVYQVDIRIFGTEGMLLLDIERPRLDLRRNDGHDKVFQIAEAPASTPAPRRFIDLWS